MMKYIILIVWITCFLQVISAQNNVPEIGAEVFIEPGQTPLEIDTWFKKLKESNMSVTRIRMFENYMHKPDGSWDYSLFDEAFKAGDKYGIKIYANLFPATPFDDVGGFKFPGSEAHFQLISNYIRNIVTHFKQFKSCFGWVPINEPGSGRIPLQEFSQKKFREWKEMQKKPVYNSKGFEHLDFSNELFLQDYNTWYLKWLTDEIHKYDPGSPIHVNNHAIFQNAAEYNFPEWRKFLTSLGGSAHASWHFGYFNRNQFAVAMSANSEIIRSGAGNIPWIMTELQGGNNTYSGYDAMCPTKEEISQWLWTTIGTGAKGAIFWCFNPRSSGFEAGEWAMLDFQNESTDRLKAAENIAGILQKNTALFANATVVESGVNIIYTRESLWIESKLQSGGKNYEGRQPGGVMKSALGYFEVLSEMGIQANFKSIDEFDFSKDNYMGITIILAHQISIPYKYWHLLEKFVSKGGKLIVDGLTAYYDENALCVMKTGFPLENLFGGNICEFKLVDNLFDVTVNKICLNAHLWQGTIKTGTGTSIGYNEDMTVAVKNKFGKGEVVWIPSLVGLGARIGHDYSKLSEFLSQEIEQSIQTAPIRFKNFNSGMLMKLLKSGDSYVGILINKSTSSQDIEMIFANTKGLNPVLIYSDKHGRASGSKVRISPEETMVIQWN